MIVRQEVSEDLKTASIYANGNVDGVSADSKILLELIDPEGKKVLETQAIVSEDGKFSTTLTLAKDLQLWYPFTYGQSPLYTIQAILPGHDEKIQKLGLRRLRLLQHTLKKEPGTSFIFEINNIRVFSGGSCWIPGDYMLPRFTRDRYEEWILLAKAGNQAMVCEILHLRGASSAHHKYGTIKKLILVTDSSLGWWDCRK